MAIARAVLANERTLLVVLRTALGCSMGGAGLPKFFNHPAYGIAGIFLMMFAALILGVGIRRYRTIKQMIGAIDPEVWQALEALDQKGRVYQG